MDDDTTLTRQQISDAVDPLGWRLVLGAIYTEVLTPSLAHAARAASAAVSAAGSEAQGHLTVDVREDRAVLRLHSAAVGVVTGRDIRLARAVSDVLPTTPGAIAVQGLEIAIDALDIAAVRPFWKAVTDFVDEPDSVRRPDRPVRTWPRDLVPADGCATAATQPDPPRHRCAA